MRRSKADLGEILGDPSPSSPSGKKSGLGSLAKGFATQIASATLGATGRGGGRGSNQSTLESPDSPNRAGGGLGGYGSLTVPKGSADWIDGSFAGVCVYDMWCVGVCVYEMWCVVVCV